MSEYQLPPLCDSSKFEKLINDLCCVDYGLDFQTYGRKGQAQYGIDGYALNANDELIVYQCKNKLISNDDKKNRIDLLRDIECEVQKSIDHFINKEKKTIKTYIFANAFKKDTYLQNKAIELTENNTIQIVVWSWEDISDKLENNIEIFQRYYSNFLVTNNRVVKRDHYIKFLKGLIKDHYNSPDFSRIPMMSKIVNDSQGAYIEMRIIEKKTEDIDLSINKEQETVKLNEILSPDEDTGSSKSLLIGTAGVGKTISAKHICRMWAQGLMFNEFEIVIFFAMNEWDADLSFMQNLLNKYYDFDCIKSCSLEKEYGVLKQEKDKVLFIFDGCDEFQYGFQPNIIDKLNKFDNFLYTSRPFGVNHQALGIKRTFEIVGLDNNRINKYISLHLSESQSKLLRLFFDFNPQVISIAQIPILLDIICILFRNNRQLFNTSNFTLTSLYQEVVGYLFWEYTEVKGYSKIQGKKDEIFNCLGEIAFDSLKDKKTILERETIQSNSDLFREYILKSGFLKGSLDAINPLRDNYRFLHVTFQEFFAALYISKSGSDKIKSTINKFKFHTHFRLFFKFLSGLIEDKSLVFDTFYEEPKDVIGYYIMLLHVECLNEVGASVDNKNDFEDSDQGVWLKYTLLNGVGYTLLLEKIKHEKILYELIITLKGTQNKIRLLCLRELLKKSTDMSTTMERLIGEKGLSNYFKAQIRIKLISLNFIKPYLLNSISDDILLFSKNNCIYIHEMYEENAIEDSDIICALENLFQFKERYRETLIKSLNLSDLKKNIANKLAGTKRAHPMQNIYNIIKDESNNISYKRGAGFPNKTIVKDILSGSYPKKLDAFKEEISESYRNDVTYECNKIITVFDPYSSSNETLSFAQKLLECCSLNSNSKNLLREYIFANMYETRIDSIKEYRFVKLVACFLKLSYCEEITTWLKSYFTNYFGGMKYTGDIKDAMYILDELAYSNYRDKNIDHILYTFLNHKGIDTSYKIDIAKGLFINGERDRQVIKILLLFVFNVGTFNSSLYELVKSDVIYLLGNDNSDIHQVKNDPYVVISDVSSFKDVNIELVFSLIHDYPFILSDSQLCDFVIKVFAFNNKPLFIKDNSLYTIYQEKLYPTHSTIILTDDEINTMKALINENIYGLSGDNGSS